MNKFDEWWAGLRQDEREAYNALHEAMMKRQREVYEETGFWPTPIIPMLETELLERMYERPPRTPEAP